MKDIEEIKSFSDLTDFIYSEHIKMQESLGLQQPSTQFCEFVEDSLKSYSKLYAKPFLRQKKRDAKLLEALNTRPHGWIWKLFHGRLWSQIKVIEKDERKAKELKDKLSELEIKRVETELASVNKMQQVLVPTQIEQTHPTYHLENKED